MVDNRTIELTHSSVHLRSDGIVEIIFKQNANIDLLACEELTSAYDKLLENKKYPLLHIAEDYVTFTKSAREYSVSERGTQYSLVEAYVINSFAHKIIANFYMKINNPPVSTRFFQNKTDAIAWLKLYQK